MKKLLSILLLNCFAAELFCTSATQPLEEAHYQLWSKICRQRRHRARLRRGIAERQRRWRWKSQLSFVVDADRKRRKIYGAIPCGNVQAGGKFQKSGEDKKKAEKLFRDLWNARLVPTWAGFIARGFASDGRSHYPCGSEDQTIPWLYGMYVYYKSSIASESARAAIREKIHASMQRTGKE